MGKEIYLDRQNLTIYPKEWKDLKILLALVTRKLVTSNNAVFQGDTVDIAKIAYVAARHWNLFQWSRRSR